jgi:dienelactone hydrolase
MINTAAYDPFAPGMFPVAVRTIVAPDSVRGRRFPTEIWSPAESRDTDRPLIIYSHSSGGHRRSATFLGTHLASHGYVVAAMDHSEFVAPELARRDGETSDKRDARVAAVIASRVPDVRFLLDYLLSDGDLGLDTQRIGLAGHSFGGWTVLATTEVEPRIRSVVAMAPGGNSNPRPGILPLTLSFVWGRDVPTLYLAAENDVMIPLTGVTELFDRTPASTRMVILRRADHQHFVDDVEGEHEAIRAASLPGDAAWIPAAMQPIDQLSSGEQAHLFVRGLTLAHLDATLRGSEAAAAFLAGDVVATLAERGVEAMAYQPRPQGLRSG